MSERHEPTPAVLSQRALDQLRFIRDTMSVATTFTAVPGRGGVVMGAAGLAAIKDAVENGLGVSIISRWAVRKEGRYGTLRLLNIQEEKILRDFSLVLNKNSVSSNSLEEFLTYLKSYPYDKLL